MKFRQLREHLTFQAKAGRVNGIVINGRANLVAGVIEEARRIVEAKHADQWQTAGAIARLKLQRTMDAEVKELATKLTPDVSSNAMY